MLSLPKVVIPAILGATLASGCPDKSGGKQTSYQSSRATIVATEEGSLTKVFDAVVPEVKAKSRIPVLLPSDLPAPVGKAKHAVVEKVAENEYAIFLYYELGIGDAGFAALFAARDKPAYNPQDLGNVREAELARGTRGFFRPVSCGGSCAPANLWWKQGEILYQVQLKMPPGLSEGEQERAIVKVADSAILVGPR